MATVVGQQLDYITPLSRTGIRDLHLDLTEAMQDFEILTIADVISSDTSLVTISSVQINSSPVTNDDGSVAQVNKAVQWRATAQKGSTGEVWLDVEWSASGGSQDVHRIRLNLNPEIRS